MKEQYEFRVFEPEATALLPSNLGKRLSELARKIVLGGDDPRLALIADAHRKARADGLTLIASWNVRRHYSAEEIDHATIFRLQIRPTFEPTGEECGTVCDESIACDICGVGRIQRSPLRLRPARIPKGQHMAITIARETVVSQEVKLAASSTRLRGFEFGRVEECDGTRLVPTWFQLRAAGQPVRIVGPSKWGINPFDPDVKEEYRCPRGHLPGLNLLTEATIDGTTWDKGDYFVSAEHEGTTGGLIRPHPIVFASKAAIEVFARVAPRTFAVEIAHLA